MNSTYLEQLGRQHGFTLVELEANQRGTLHPSQRARGVRKGLVAVTVLTLLGVMALGGGGIGAYWSYEPGLSTVDRNAVHAIAGAGTLLALFFFICAGTSLVRFRARQAAFTGGRLDVVEGPMNKTLIRGRGAPSQYIFRVGGRSFHTSEKLWELLTQGANYRLYCVADQLLSFAPAAAPDGISASLDDPVERAGYNREIEHLTQTRKIRPSRSVG